MAQALDGVAELTRKLKEIADPKENQKVLRQAVGAAMRKVQKEARSRIPVGTQEHKTYKGRLVAPGFASRSLRVVTTTDKQTGAAVARLGVRREAFYATQFVELGTAKMPRQPWLVVSFLSQQDAALREIGLQMFQRIKKIQDKRA